MLETALDEHALAHVALYAVTTVGTPVRRVKTLVGFLADQLQAD